MNGPAPSSYVLYTQPRLDVKWLKTDIQQCLTPDGLATLWNELIKDGELTGLFSDGILNSAGVVSKKGKNCFVFQLFRYRCRC